MSVKPPPAFCDAGTSTAPCDRPWSCGSYRIGVNRLLKDRDNTDIDLPKFTVLFHASLCIVCSLQLEPRYHHLPAQGFALIGIQAPCTDTNRLPLRSFEGGGIFLALDLVPSQSLCGAMGDRPDVQRSFVKSKSQRKHRFGENKTHDLPRCAISCRPSFENLRLSSTMESSTFPPSPARFAV